MTALLNRLPPRVEPPAELGPRPVAMTALFAALGAGLAGLLPCVGLAVAGWLAGPAGSLTAALRVGVTFWLYAHGGAVTLAGLPLAILPLGLTLAAALLLYRAGRWAAGVAAVSTVREVAVAVGTLTAGYGLLAACLVLVAGQDASHADRVRSVVGAAVLALLAGGAGVVRGDRSDPSHSAAVRWAGRIPATARAAGRGGFAAVAVLVAGSTILLAGSLAVHFDRERELLTALHAGRVGSALVVLLALAFLPNAVVYTGAFAVGPGFVVGSGTSVALTGVEVGRLPAFPLLGALPAPGTPPRAALALLALPLLAGLVGGAVAGWRHRVREWDVAAVRGAAAGVVGAVGFAVLALLSGGSAGTVRLARIGPTAWQVAATAGLSLAVGGTLAGLATALWFGHRAQRVPAGPVSRRSDGAVPAGERTVEVPLLDAGRPPADRPPTGPGTAAG